jgi:hypothetical protein
LVYWRTLKHLEDEAIAAPIEELCMKITGELNADKHLKQLATLNGLLASGHWLFTSPGAVIVITILVVEVTSCIWRKCCRSVTMALTLAAPLAPPPLLVFNKMITSVMVTLS